MTWSVHALVQAIILGVLTGGVYALMASGQTLIFGIMKVVNLAQAAFVVLAAYLTFSLFTLTGMDPFLSILITTPILFAMGVVIQWTLLRHAAPRRSGAALVARHLRRCARSRGPAFPRLQHHLSVDPAGL